MTKIIHISDLHFGTANPAVVEEIIFDINFHSPDVVVISGDLTQRAKTIEFSAAKNFINRFKVPFILSVPGNHDITLYNPWKRFFETFDNYKYFISSNLEPLMETESMIIVGLNTATPYKPKGGHVTQAQLEKLKKILKDKKNKIKCVVMHHNLVHSERHKVINNSSDIIKTFLKCEVNLVFTGHIHLPYLEKVNVKGKTHAMYLISAGTAVSTRLGPYKNSYNLIEVNDNSFKMEIMTYRNGKFVTTNKNQYMLR